VHRLLKEHVALSTYETRIVSSRTLPPRVRRGGPPRGEMFITRYVGQWIGILRSRDTDGACCTSEYLTRQRVRDWSTLAPALARAYSNGGCILMTQAFLRSQHLTNAWWKMCSIWSVHDKHEPWSMPRLSYYIGKGEKCASIAYINLIWLIPTIAASDGWFTLFPNQMWSMHCGKWRRSWPARPVASVTVTSCHETCGRAPAWAAGRSDRSPSTLLNTTGIWVTLVG
jgi:hypothetical protein